MVFQLIELISSYLIKYQNRTVLPALLSQQFIEKSTQYHAVCVVRTAAISEGDSFLPQSVDLIVLSQWHDCLRLRVWKNMLSFSTKTVKEYAIFSYIRTVSGPIANRYISMDVFHCSCGTIGSTRMGQKRGLGEIMGTRGKSSAILVTSCSVCKDDSYLSLFYLFFCSCQPLSHH